MRHRRLCVTLLVMALAGCAGPPQPAPGQILGYGTPGVESYLAPGVANTLAELQSRCRTVPVGAEPPPQTLQAACDQLRRTAHNQPGNTVDPARPSSARP